MKAKEYKYPNVVSFFLILSPLIYGIMLFVTLPASNQAKILQIKRRYSIN